MASTADAEQRSTALLSRIAGGDDNALADFYRLHESTVYAFALNRLNDPHAAADVVNEVMIGVWRGADRFQGSAKVRTWLLGITHNKVVDRLRARHRHDADELNDDMVDDDQATALDAVAHAEDTDRLKQCIDRLTDAHRQVVHLGFFEDLSYGEVAEIVGCPEGTVKTRMYHAKQSLKRCLAQLTSG